MNELAVHPKGDYLAAADDSGAVKIFNTRTRRSQKTLKNAHMVRIQDRVAFAGNSRWVGSSHGREGTFWAKKRYTLLPVELLECGTVGQYMIILRVYFGFGPAHRDVGSVARTNVVVVFGPKKGIPCYRLSSSSVEPSVSI